VTRVLYVFISNTPPTLSCGKAEWNWRRPKSQIQERETERTPSKGKRPENTKGTRCSSTKMGHGAKNGRLKEVKLDEETSLPIQSDSLTIVQLTGQKVEPSVLD
jgi:hypothetical protein